MPILYPLLLGLLNLLRVVLSLDRNLHCTVQVLDRVVHQDAGNNHPEDVEETKVEVVVVRVGVAMGRALNHGSGVVEDAAVELTERDDELGDVAGGSVVVHCVCNEERQWAPRELQGKEITNSDFDGLIWRVQRNRNSTRAIDVD